VTLGGTVDGGHALTANAQSGALRIDGAVGGATPLAALTATGNTIAVGAVATTGAQTYTAEGGLTLNGNLTASAVTVTGPTTLGSDVTVSTAAGNGNIAFSGSTSTLDGAHALALAAGGGNVTLGGVVGGNTRLTSVDVSGYDLTLPDIFTVGDANQTYTARDNITLTQSRTLDAPISFTADADNDGNGAFILLNGVSLTATNNPLTIQAADIQLQGNSTLASGTGLMTLIATDARNIMVEDSGTTPVAGQMTITGTELSRMSSSGGLDLKTTGSGWIDVNGVTAADSQNITGTLSLLAQGTGDVSFITAPSTFNALTVNATAGTTSIGVGLTTNNAPIDFATAATVSGAATIDSGNAGITFGGTLAVDGALTLTGNAVAFAGAVSGNQTLTLNLGSGSVSAASLGELQSTLTGLTVNSTSSIALPALTISGPQVYDTGVITATGDLHGIG
ncbi:MAG: beta strand repeat-containing protein, partial [Steroidobacteraceae bacterium]